jgi:hypothetical protein
VPVPVQVPEVGELTAQVALLTAHVRALTEPLTEIVEPLRRLVEALHAPPAALIEALRPPAPVVLSVPEPVAVPAPAPEPEPVVVAEPVRPYAADPLRIDDGDPDRDFYAALSSRPVMLTREQVALPARDPEPEPEPMLSVVPPEPPSAPPLADGDDWWPSDEDLAQFRRDGSS